MKTNAKASPDFLSEVTDEMDKGGEDAYGADMEDDEEAEADDAREDMILAAKQVAKALGVTVSDPERFADALKTFVRACSSAKAAPVVDVEEVE